MKFLIGMIAGLLFFSAILIGAAMFLNWGYLDASGWAIVRVFWILLVPILSLAAGAANHES